MHHDDGTDLPRRAAAAGGVLGGTDELARSLERWAAEAMVDEAARQRTRQRWLRLQAEEEASLLGALVDLAERGRPRGARRAATSACGARSSAIGADFLAVRSDRGQDVLVRTGAVDVVPGRAGRARRGRRSGRARRGHPRCASLGPLAAERPEVVVRTRAGQVVRGELRSAGTDVVRLRADGDPPSPVWVPLAAIDLLVVDP